MIGSVSTLSATQTFVSTMIIVGVGVFVLMACSAFMGHSVAKLQGMRLLERTGRMFWYMLGLLALISVWFAAALAASTANFISFTILLPFALFPIVLGTLLSLTSRREQLISAIPTHWLIFLQTYRVVGGIFIFPYLAEGVLTRGFALNAGIGDVITGIFAVPVAWLVLRGGERYKWVFYSWTAFGIIDLIVAPASAALFGFAANGSEPGFPVTAIPLFFGPPFGILIHIIALRNFQLRHVTKKSRALR